MNHPVFYLPQYLRVAQDRRNYIIVSCATNPDEEKMKCTVFKKYMGSADSCRQYIKDYVFNCTKKNNVQDLRSPMGNADSDRHYAKDYVFNCTALQGVE